MRAALLVCVVVGARASSPLSSSCSTTPKTDIGGHDVGELYPCASIDACCAACAQAAACTQAVYQENAPPGANACYFKGGGDPEPAAEGLTLVSAGPSTPTPPPAPTPPAPPTPPTPPPAPPTPAPAPPAHPPARTVWPLPANWTYDSSGPWPTFSGPQQRAVLAPSFDIACSGCPAELGAAAARYRRLMLLGGEPVAGNPEGAASTLGGLDITLADHDAALAIGADESYSLRLGNGTDVRAALSANTQWGAMRGLETFAQLVRWSGADPQDGGAYVGNASYYVENLPMELSDAPRFPWRGLMVDSSRHFLGRATLMRVLDAMSYNKMNVMHWHATDDNSWSIESATYPNFHKVGAYAPRMVHTVADIAALRKYARERGIVIYVEFDVPSHGAGIWGGAYPNTTSPWPSSLNSNDEPRAGCIVEPTGIAGKVLGGLAAEFGDAATKPAPPLEGSSSAASAAVAAGLVHFGGDEVGGPGCWASDPRVQAWAKALGEPYVTSNGTVNTTTVHARFEVDAAKAAIENGVTPVFWLEDAWTACNENPIFDDMPKETIFASWSGAEQGKVVRDGFRAINNWGWYLDQTNPAGTSPYAYADTWNNMYDVDPVASVNIDPPLTVAEARLILGGEATMFGERIDATNFDQWVWPRACAVAERLWSDMAQINARNPPGAHQEANGRLERQRCHMVRRGIGAGPAQPQSEFGGELCELPASWNNTESCI